MTSVTVEVYVDGHSEDIVGDVSSSGVYCCVDCSVVVVTSVIVDESTNHTHSNPDVILIRGHNWLMDWSIDSKMLG